MSKSMNLLLTPSTLAPDQSFLVIVFCHMRVVANEPDSAKSSMSKTFPVKWKAIFTGQSPIIQNLGEKQNKVLKTLDG